MRKAKLTSVATQNCSFESSDLSEIESIDGVFMEGDFSQVILDDAKFTGNTKFTSSLFPYASFKRVLFDKILVSNCNMKDAVFNGGGIKSTRIQDTYLDNSKFIGA